MNPPEQRTRHVMPDYDIAGKNIRRESIQMATLAELR
jgi:hypothetical protein